MARRKSVDDVWKQLNRISNYSQDSQNRHRRSIDTASNNAMGRALNNSKLGKVMKRLAEAEAKVYRDPSPSYRNAAQKLGWMHQAGDKEATKALSARTGAVAMGLNAS